MKSKFIKLSLAVFFPLMILGCGHSMQSNTKGIGIDVSWNGESYIPSLRLGYWDSSAAVVRGNTSYTTTTATGSNVFSAGGSQITTQLYAGPQLNEGYLKQVLISDKNSDHVKIEIIKSVLAAKTPTPAPSVARTAAAAGGTGNNVHKVKEISSSIDKIIQQTSKPIIDDINQNANVTENKTIDKYSIAKISIIAFICILIIILIIKLIYSKKKDKNKIISD